MLTAGFLVVTALCAGDTGFQMLYFLHMLQLNSYRNERYIKWSKEHEQEVLPSSRFFGFVGLAVMLIFSAGKLASWEVAPSIGVWIAAALMAVTVIRDIPKKAKKPLVITGRVKRMMVTFGVLAVLVLGGSFLLGFLPGFACFCCGCCCLWRWCRWPTPSTSRSRSASTIALSTKPSRFWGTARG